MGFNDGLLFLTGASVLQHLQFVQPGSSVAVRGWRVCIGAAHGEVESSCAAFADCNSCSLRFQIRALLALSFA